MLYQLSYSPTYRVTYWILPIDSTDILTISQYLVLNLRSVVLKEINNGRKEKVSSARHGCDAPEKAENSTDEKDVINAPNFACPLGLSNGVTYTFTVFNKEY